MDRINDFCILGAGIAGLSLADALNKRDYSVVVIEKDDVASGASGTPGALVNPATGRRAKKSWKAEACYRAIRANLEKIQAHTDIPFYRNNGLLRPALTQKMAGKMREQFEKTRWPDGWCHWLSEKEIKQKHPGINCTEGGLWLPIGLTVDAGAYLKAYAAYLQNQGIVICKHFDATIQRSASEWHVSDDEHRIKSEHLVFATGYGTVNHTEWDFLPLEGVKGQLARFRADRELLTFDHSISSLGYITRLSNGNTFIQGSTYEHDFDEVTTDREGEQYLRKRMARTLPELAKKAELVDQWAGVRVFTPDKKPVLGRHPEIENLHLFSALGSKGLMYGKFLAGHYADHLKNGSELFPEISIKRFS